VKTRKTLEDELPAARYLSVTSRRMGPAFTTHAMTNREHSFTCMPWDAKCARRASVRARVPRRNARWRRPFHGYRDRRWPLSGGDRQARRAARRVDIVFRDLTKPGSFFEVLVWGLDARFEAIRAQGRGM